MIDVLKTNVNRLTDIDLDLGNYIFLSEIKNSWWVFQRGFIINDWQ